MAEFNIKEIEKKLGELAKTMPVSEFARLQEEYRAIPQIRAGSPTLGSVMRKWKEGTIPEASKMTMDFLLPYLSLEQMGPGGGSQQAISKLAYLNRLKELGVPGGDIAKRIGRKVLKPIEGIFPMKDFPGRESLQEIVGAEGMPFLRGGITTNIRAPDVGRRAKLIEMTRKAEKETLPSGALEKARIQDAIESWRSEIGFSSEPRALTATHEPGHILYGFLTQKERDLVDRAYRMMDAKGELDMLTNLTQVSYISPKELISEGYAQYLSNSPAFKEFPPVVRKLIKKYHKLGR